MTEPMHGQFDEVRELVAELAMGVAPGGARAAALAHIATCADCRTRLEETTALVDELLLLAPEHEPPAGFETRVLTALTDRGPLRRRRATWLAAAAAAVLVALGSATAVTRWVDADDRRLAEQYRQTLQVADGSYLRAAVLTSGSGSGAGHVFAYQGKPSWVFMTVEGAPSGDYDVTLVTRDGRVHSIGECWVRDGRGSWGTTVDAPVDAIDRIEMSGDGGPTLTAEFGS
jgi:hypothetical protein